MSWVAFIKADPDNPPKCTTCNDYGGIYDDETIDSYGHPYDMACPDCANNAED